MQRVLQLPGVLVRERRLEDGAAELAERQDRLEHYRRTGRVVWERTAREERPRAPSMRDGTWASSSAITDGQRVFAFFESSGLYAYDMDGTLLWQKHFGDKNMFAEVGESGSTPVLYGNHLAEQ